MLTQWYEKSTDFEDCTWKCHWNTVNKFQTLWSTYKNRYVTENFPCGTTRVNVSLAMECARLHSSKWRIIYEKDHWPLPKQAGSWVPINTAKALGIDRHSIQSINQSSKQAKKCRGSAIAVYYLAAQTATIVVRHFCLAFLLVLPLQTIPSAFAFVNGNCGDVIRGTLFLTCPVTIVRCKLCSAYCRHFSRYYIIVGTCNATLLRDELQRKG